MSEFTHMDKNGRASMVDVGSKDITVRSATAEAFVMLNVHTFSLLNKGELKKGDALTVAKIAGIMGAKQTSNLIPLCHPIMIDGIDLSLVLCPENNSVKITATVTCEGKTGVEMEAMTAVSVAALTVYDMCKAVQRDITITDIRLLKKSGGVHGDYHREDEQ